MDFKENLKGNQKERFCSVANKLLNECFVLKPQSRGDSDYAFVLENKELFEEYFDFIGYDLNVDKTIGVIGLSNRNGTGRLRLKKVESILLLILRSIYIEKKKELSTTSDIIIEASAIYNKYTHMGFNRKTMDKSTIPNAISLFKKYNLVEVLSDKSVKDDTRIIIYPSILMAVTYDSLDKAYQIAQDKLKEYKLQGNNIREEKTNEETDAN